MRLQRITGAMGGVAGVLLAMGVVLDTTEIMLAAAVVLLYICSQALIFDLQVRNLSRLVHVQRKVGHHILRQGSATTVVTSLQCPAPEGLRLQFRDTIPAGTRVLRGKTKSGCMDPQKGLVTLEYDLQTLTRGDLFFPGIILDVEDRFFGDTVFFGWETFQIPLLHVQPFSTYSEPASQAEYGGLEIAKVRAIHGQGIRSFRVFQTGDDTRAIDWKLSAKHGKLILREYMGKIGGAPVFVLDMPERLDDAAVSAYDRLVAALTSRIESAVREFSRIDVVVLSGARAVRTLSLRRDPRPWYRLLGSLCIGEGFQPLYRHPFPLVLASLRRTAEKSSQSGGNDQAFFSRLAAITGSFLQASSPTAYERQLAAALLGKRERELYLFSLFKGDQSHTREAIHRARKERMSVHIRVPTHSASPALRHTLLEYGASTV
ncbi:MAG: DUF58 domain-containing protein, partial [Methanomicrobiales archaeon]|nr:DUF58 domain-containing protein [Methanomicrobiales archaeon]